MDPRKVRETKPPPAVVDIARVYNKLDGLRDRNTGLTIDAVLDELDAVIKSMLHDEMVKAKASELTHSDFIKAVMAGVVQMKIKKAASKTYPVRFAEITKIETIKAGS